MTKGRSVKSSKQLRLSKVVDTRVIYCGDNLEHLKKLPDSCVDLIYIDPPFHSNRNYEVFWGEAHERRSFEDRHESIRAYIEFMRPRCVQLARVLRPTGSFYYHCDWHAGHYIKVMLDDILGVNNFRNHIIWKRSSAHSDTKQGMSQCGRVCDFILYYTGGGKTWTWNPQFQPYDDDYVEAFYRHQDPTGRRYRLSDLTAAKPGGDTEYEWRVKRPDGGQTDWVPDLENEYLKPKDGWSYMGVKPYKGRYWAYTHKKMAAMALEERLYHARTGMPSYKRYLDEMPGVALQDLWTDIKPVPAGGRERVGYPTQKPLALLERIFKASTNEGDIVLDAFCGCGTALEAAEKLGRQWIGIDISPTACHVMAKRLRDNCYLKQDEALWRADRGFIVRDLPWTEDRLRQLPPFEFENWAIIALNGVPNKTKVGDFGIDGKLFPTGELGGGKGASGEQLLLTTDMWYPVQVKQKDKAGRPDIDAFEAAMMRFESEKGFFVAFGFTRDALQEIRLFQKRSGKEIIAVTVGEILEEEAKARYA